MSINTWLIALPILLGMGFVTWIYSLRTKDVSIVDSLWSLMFLAASCVYLLSANSLNDRSILIFTLIAIWALRLSVFLTIRNWGKEEDRRYQEIRANNEPFWIKSLYIVFGLQTLLAWLISVPLLAAVTAVSDFSLLDLFAVCIWTVGFLFEAISDNQLYQFKKSPANNNKTLNTGLWRYSRHPNYFGEALIWWAYYLFAVQFGPWWIVFAPLLMTILLLKVSGVALMEKDIGDRKPEYRDYILRTNAFIPWLPKASKTRTTNLEAS